MTTLSCGHEATWTPSGAHACGTKGEPTYYPKDQTGGKVVSMTTGTAHTADGREVCHPCAEREEEKALRDSSTFCAYLDCSGKFITNWTGGILASVQGLRKTHAGFGGERHYFRATDNAGGKWSGNSPGPGMFCRLRRIKGS